MRGSARAAAALVSLALVATTATTGAGVAHAADPVAPPQVFAADGANFGVVVYWQPPLGFYDSFITTLYDAADTTFSLPLAQKVESPVGSPSTDYGGYGAEFFGLTAGLRIRATVVASFEGATSEPVVTDVMQVYAPIAEVTRLAVRPRDHALTVSWVKPQATALTGPLTGYRVIAYDAGVIGYQEFVPSYAWVPPTATSVTLRGQLGPLVNGRRYTVEVVPLAGDAKRYWPNNQFRRDYPLASRVTAAPFGPAAKPTKLRYAWRSHGRALLTWKRSSASVGRPVTGYRVYVNGTRVRSLDGRDATRCTVKHLKRGKVYTFKVAAINAAGPGPRASTGRHRRP